MATTMAAISSRFHWFHTKNPMPRPPTSISAAIMTSQEVDSDNRSPVIIPGSAAGIHKWVIRSQKGVPKVAVRLIWVGLTFRTASIVLISVGHKADKTITNTAVFSALDSRANPSGSQAKGETGRSTWIKGSSAQRNDVSRPSANPNGMAITVAIRKPIRTRCRLARICQKIPTLLGPSR